MTATLEQTQADLLHLIGLAQKGEEVVIVSQGRALAKLTAVHETNITPNRQAWLARLAALRERVATDKTGLSVEQILDEDRGD
jgi:antitoxin (DNA-binding transcriptional repressor) of toxin-antitoxin stability system